ncbi:MAG: TRAP transporter small permease subunit [Cyclobacteriaceae bacterium]|nr:TRAP transporter small permease subunit [Cyclobacteriaceae bacterium HetDA_MAG_MS6]
MAFPILAARMRVVFEFIDLVNRRVGQAVSWLSLMLVLVIVLDVFLRYTFNFTTVATFELEWHLFAAIFMLSAGWTLQADKHVRVDLFYQRFSVKGQAWVNLCGSLFLLLPLCCIAFSESIAFVKNSFAVGETSPDPGGLPARYVIKSAIPLGFLLLGLQGLSQVLKCIQVLIEKSDK